MKYHFEEYNDLECQIQELQYKLKAIENDLYSIRGVSYDLMPKGNGYTDNLVYKIAEKDDIIKDIARLKTKKQFLFNKHMLEISKVSDERYRCILRSCYLHHIQNESIANMISVSISHYWVLKRDAIREFKERNNLA